MKILPSASEIVPMIIVSLLVMIAVNKIAPLKAIVG